MEQLHHLITQLNSKPKEERNNFYRDAILPIISDLLHQQYQQYLQSNNYNSYLTLITTLSHDINILLLLLYSIKPKYLVVFYTSDKNKLIEKLYPLTQSLQLNIETIQLDSTNHNNNNSKIKDTIKRYKKNYHPVLCDITGGKKIFSTQIGILAHSLKTDIAYIDSSKGFLQWGIPLPGTEILYIQKPDNIFNLLEIYHANKLRIRFNSISSNIEYEADVNGRLYRLGQKKLKPEEIDKLVDYVNRFYMDINASIINNSYSTINMGKYALSFKTLLFTKELNHFVSIHNNLTHLVIDNELSAFPWEFIFAHCNVSLPLFRIPNRDSNFIENNKCNNQKSIAFITGYGENLPDFATTVHNIKLLLSKEKQFSLATITAKNSFELKKFFAEYSSNPFTVVIFFGHAAFGNCSENTGLICQDGSIFSIEDCDVLSGSPPECILINSCQSARCSLFTPNSFAHAVINSGVETYIGTHFFLEYKRSICFLQSFLKAIACNHTYADAYKYSIDSITQQFGKNDISTYNYVYYGY